MTSFSLPRPSAQSGFTLVELLVALALSMLLGVALIKMQSSMGTQAVVTADVGTRDTQSRAAMDLITQDLSGAGFLFGATQAHCNALMTYNTASFFVGHRVDSVAASTTATLPFAPTLTLNYPPASGGASTIASDVLVIQTNLNSTIFNDATNPSIKTVPSTTILPLTTGQLPLQSTTGLTLNDSAIVQAPMAGKTLCMRVPMTTIGPGAAVTSANSASSPTMPTNFYTGFAGKTAAAGFTGSLSNAELYQSHIVDIGSSTTTPMQTVVYYVKGTSTWPVLMRDTYNGVTDALVSSQQIAVGVAALQVRFGVDPGTGTVSYYTGAQVTTNKTWDSVVSTKVALITRTITANADGYTAASIPMSSAFGSWFVIPSGSTGFQNYRFFDTETEIFSRNQSWN